MIRVEIMAHADPQTLQDGINNFIKDKKVIDIKYQSLAVPAETINGVPSCYNFIDRALIIYEEKGVYR